MSTAPHDGAPAPDAPTEAVRLQGFDVRTEGLVPRPRALSGATYQVETPLGAVFATVNVHAGSDGDEPLEVFVQVGKAGTDLAALAETIGRLCSVCLQLPGPVPARDRVAILVSQLGRRWRRAVVGRQARTVAAGGAGPRASRRDHNASPRDPSESAGLAQRGARPLPVVRAGSIDLARGRPTLRLRLQRLLIPLLHPAG